jgi:hypothetical protein
MNSVRVFYPSQQGFRRLQVAVAACFERHFGANPRPEPDQFWCLAGCHGEAPGHGCVGLSWGGSAKLFSEHFLDLCVHESRMIPARQLVEIGQFASFSGAGAGTYLMSRVLRFLKMKQDRCAILTATYKVRCLLAALNVEFDDLGPARIERVRDKDVDWGTYYQHQPRVILIDLQRGIDAMPKVTWAAPTEPRSERAPPLKRQK